MNDSGDSEMTPKLPSAVEQMRKPEARSEYSDVLADAMRAYLDEIFNQDPLPPELAELKAQKSIILFEGSVLRGTASERTSDLDVLLIRDDQHSDDQFEWRLMVAMRDIDKYHPHKIHFPQYLMNRLRADPKLQKYYLSRIAEVQRRLLPGVSIDVSYDPEHFIHLDTSSEQMSNFLSAIQEGDFASLRRHESNSRWIVTLLTAPSELVYEILPGSLLYHQRQIVEELMRLKERDPRSFDNLYVQLRKDFMNAHRSTAVRYPERDYKMLAEYYIREGRFVTQHLDARRLVELVSRRLLYRFIVRNFEDLRRAHPHYKDNPELLLKHMGMKYKAESGLSNSELERMAKGESVTPPDESELSADERKEVEELAKRVTVLSGLRRQILMPTLEELREAYLIPAIPSPVGVDGIEPSTSTL